MVAYEFPSRVAKDPTLDALVKDGVGYIYALSDTSHTNALTITDRFGLPKANVRTTFDGVTEEFFCEDHPIVWWVSGPYAFLIVSFTGLKQAAEVAMQDAANAVIAALAAQAAAEAASGSASGASDTGTRDLINNASSLTRQALEQVIPVIAAKVVTVDSQDEKKIIALANGTVLAIPRGAVAPAKPAPVMTTSGAAMVRVKWTAVPGASTYALSRNGVQVIRTDGLSYMDVGGAPNTTYSYTLTASDPYGQRSPVSDPVNGSFDSALNVPPFAEIRTWPATIPPAGTVLVRVNAVDADAQSLAMTLGVDVGALRPTQDPSVWLYTI